MTPLTTARPLRHRPGSRLRRCGSQFLPIFLSALFIGACLEPTAEPPQPPVDPAASPFRSSSSDPDPTAFSTAQRPITQIFVEFSMLRFTAPRGTFSRQDAAIWRTVTGPLPSASMTLQLADSGFRAAIGQESDRRALAETMTRLRETTDLRSIADQITPDASREIEIDIGPASWPRLAVFYVDAHGALAGQDFQDAKVKFLMSFALRPENLREVWVQMMPVIEEPPGPPRWVGTPDGGFQQLPELRRRVFSEVAMTAPIPEGGFLLLGPTEIVYDRPYLARPFFVEQPAARARPPVRGGEEKPPEVRESVYIISPILRSLHGEPAVRHERPSEPGSW